MLRWMLVVTALVLSLIVIPAQASGACPLRHCDDDSETTVNNSYFLKKDRLTFEDYAKSVGITAVVGCGLYAGYQGLENKRWRWPIQWCTDFLRKEARAADNGRVTPDNLSDRPIGVRVYQ